MKLELKNITKKYGDRVIFDNFSYEFDNCGLYILSGMSGAGKTTLLRIICGLDKNFDGCLSAAPTLSYSFCFQEYRLFPQLSALENILQLSYDSRSDENTNSAMQMLRRLRFSDEELHYSPARLSGGMKQRVSFARAVLNDSDVLLLDEPTKEVDESIAKEMLNIIIEEASKRLVLLVTHNPEDIASLSANIIHIGAQV